MIKSRLSKIVLIIFIQAVSFGVCEFCLNTDAGASSFNQAYAYFSEEAKSVDIWERFRSGTQLRAPSQQKLYRHYVDKYKKSGAGVYQLSTQAEPYLHYIMEKLQERGMPSELALLPMVESAFKPTVVSSKGAAGIWQIMPHRGRDSGLLQDAWYDGRRDITASTIAALDYLQFLYETFDDNWFLALAAYNCGPGNVQKAIRKNKRLGRGTSYWELDLPLQSKQFVPKLLALAEVIQNAHEYGMLLPIIEDQPYFVAIDINNKLDLKVAARLAGIHIKVLQKLNPGYKQGTTHPKKAHQLLLPVENAEMFEVNLAKFTSQIILNGKS